ncbi:glycine-rich domain-containing protein [Comamonas sp. 4034]|uniref:glycine-rich domain-containing protein n=1 Tax=Comamonas sp. 4034 TaxID=3156455 RepID=UPI003D1E835A
MYLVWLAGAVALVVGVWWRRRMGRSRLRQQRLRYVQAYAFQPRYYDALRVAYPRLDAEGYKHAEHALRQFFVMHLLAPGERLLMPSNLADALWHTFILDTRRYQLFCHQAFGQMFHHIPSHDMPPSAGAAGEAGRERMQATWNAAMASKRWLPLAMLGGIPLLFALDAHSGIEGGQRFAEADLRYWAVQYARMASAANADASGGSAGSGQSDSQSSGNSDWSTSDQSCASTRSAGGDDGGSSGSSAGSCDSNSSSCSGCSCGGSSCGGGGSD